jgi:hypothetical protein
MIGLYLLVWGAVCGVVGSILIAKSTIWPSIPQGDSRPFWSDNPLVIQSERKQRNEAIAGMLWICFGLVSVSLGTILTSQELKDQWWVVILLGALGVFGYWLTVILTKKNSQTATGGRADNETALGRH